MRRPVRPDALMVPTSLMEGKTLFERTDSILEFAEPMLWVDRSRGERAYIRKQPNWVLFITRDPSDTIYHPTRTPKQGTPRYEWRGRQDGIRRGYLIKETTA